MSSPEHRADPLTWGHGPHLFEMFLEPTCPFSVRAFNKMDALLEQAGEDKITVKLRMQPQPWHMFTGVVTRCVLAASMLDGGKENAKRVLAEVGARREEFEFEKHCKGANMDATPRQIIQRIEAYTGLALQEAFEFPELEAEIKRHAKYARQNGIHVSPTFMVDGLVQADLGSGDPVDVWIKRLLG
ncbi:thioredoxin [Neorhizobium sp. NCHU2750]|uniref:DsbA family protein n=1 Tax=Neorhizobium sp. NCHU2750 TaxID=1825976 RepID=UPI000E715A65|nr:thioredoxin [Neorhizobium sp. NCHU2750]